jgi:multicomponent Na+:H+ antiporter subunit A
MLALTVLLALIAAPVALLARYQPRGVNGWLLALIPLALFAFYAGQAPAVMAGAVPAMTVPWVPSMGLQFSFALDGLSLLFAMLVSGIGALIVLYAGYYLANDSGQGRFIFYLLLFMGSMLGLVLSGNVLTMFVFWELTSVTSYLLVGFKHDYPTARRGAQMGLLVTVAGGLALLVGLLILGSIAGSYEFADILAADNLREHPLYPAAMILIFLGCFTKSAQFPFHFWLPNAMQAPTPASAFLHSATMVKAGIYLLARLNPALGGTALWTYTLVAVGGFTMLFAAMTALRKMDIKALLAYSTISWLGTLTMLAGLSTPEASVALVAGILAHALYKGCLFLIAGAVDHAAGTRDLSQLGGLSKIMPASMVIAILAALSMAGIPILFGFVAKEFMLKAAIASDLAAPVLYTLLAAIVVAAAFGVAYSWRMIRSVFLGERGAGVDSHAHEAPLGMLVGPGVLGGLSLMLSLGLLPAVSSFLAPAANAVAGESVKTELYLFRGFNLAVLLSGLAIGGGFAMTFFERGLLKAPGIPERFSADSIYDAGVDGLLKGTTSFTSFVQHGNLRQYIRLAFLAMLVIVGVPYLWFGLGSLSLPAIQGVFIYEWLIAALIIVGVLATIRARSRLGAIIAASMIGAMVATVFVLFSAPDLALTQLLIEVLSTVFLVFVFAVLPARFEKRSTGSRNLRNGVIAGLAGLLMTGLVLSSALDTQFPRISPYFMAESVPGGRGENVVNVILVDFRSLDTLGEITVLFIAVLGIYAMLRMRHRQPAVAVDDTERTDFTAPNGHEQLPDRPANGSEKASPEAAPMGNSERKK